MVWMGMFVFGDIDKNESLVSCVEFTLRPDHAIADADMRSKSERYRKYKTLQALYGPLVDQRPG
jgi:hypothetical protein